MSFSRFDAPVSPAIEEIAFGLIPKCCLIFVTTLAREYVGIGLGSTRFLGTIMTLKLSHCRTYYI